MNSTETKNIDNTPARVSADQISDVIVLEHVTKVYKLNDQRITALNDVNLVIKAGEIVAVIGESGSGKSTLLQCIGCIERPSGGSVRIAGLSTDNISDGQLSRIRRSTIGFVFQSFFLQPFLTLSDNIKTPAIFAGLKRQELGRRVSVLLAKVGLSDRAGHLPRQLSGGQIQRAAIARALVNNPTVILADEPTGNLDSANSQMIMDLFQTVRKEYGTTIVIVTHSEELAAQADRIIRMRDGAIL